MNGTFIATTPKHTMHALAYQGIMITECYTQLQDMLRHRLGDEYALLFAEPAFNMAENSIDWYSPLHGPVQHLTDLPDAEQNIMREKIAHLAKQLHLFAEELLQAPESSKNTRGNVLTLALRYPEENCLYVIAGQPVFTCWGYGPGTPGAEPQDLCRITSLAPAQNVPATPIPAPQSAPLAAVAAVAEPEPTPEPQRRSLAWLWWLLPLLLLLLLLAILCTSFGTYPALGKYSLFHVPAPTLWQKSSPELTALRESNYKLEQHITTLRSRLEEYTALCVPKQPQQLTYTPNQEKLSIPENSDDMTFLSGRWRCETGIFDVKTNLPVIVEFQFDKNGKGTGTVFKQDDKCQGNATANLTATDLHIMLEKQQCSSKGNSYEAQSIRCRNIDGTAHCQGENQSGRSWDAQFFRISR